MTTSGDYQVFEAGDVLLQSGVMRMRRIPHGFVGAVVARLVAIPDGHELRHNNSSRDVAQDASTASLIRPAKASASFFAPRSANGRIALPKPWPSKAFKIVMRVAPSPAVSRS